MNKIEYNCICYDIRGDITYCAETTNFDDAVNKVNYYRKLIEDNGEQDMHSRIEVSKSWLDEDGEEIRHKVLKTFTIN